VAAGRGRRVERVDAQFVDEITTAERIGTATSTPSKPNNQPRMTTANATSAGCSFTASAITSGTSRWPSSMGWRQTLPAPAALSQANQKARQAQEEPPRAWAATKELATFRISFARRSSRFSLSRS